MGFQVMTWVEGESADGVDDADCQSEGRDEGIGYHGPSGKGGGGAVAGMSMVEHLCLGKD